MMSSFPGPRTTLGASSSSCDLPASMCWLERTARAQHVCLTLYQRMDMEADEIAAVLGLGADVVADLLVSAYRDLTWPPSLQASVRWPRPGISRSRELAFEPDAMSG